MKIRISVMVLVVAMVFIAGSASAANIRYRLSGDWTDLSDGSTPGWENGVAPGLEDRARINWNDNTVTVTTTVTGVGRIEMGVDELGTVVVENGASLSTDNSGSQNGRIYVGSNFTGTMIVKSGGVVNVDGILWVSNNAVATGTLTVDAGATINVANHFWWGRRGIALIEINGTINQTGGILGLGTNNAQDSGADGGVATVNVNSGGLLAMNNIHGGILGGDGNYSIQPGSVLNVNGTGQVTLPGDFVDVLNAYVANGSITAEGGAEVVGVDFDTTNAGFTTVQVFVEPEDPFAGGEPISGMPVTGAIGLGLLAAACALGGSMVIRKK